MLNLFVGGYGGAADRGGTTAAVATGYFGAGLGVSLYHDFCAPRRGV